jgi:hypothetical protein
VGEQQRAAASGAFYGASVRHLLLDSPKKEPNRHRARHLPSGKVLLPGERRRRLAFSS